MTKRSTHSNDTRDDLLGQLVERFTARMRAGETPSIDEYQKRHPELKDELHELLSSVAMIEGLKHQTSSVCSGSGGRFEDAIQLDRLGEYRIVRELGRGGMGIVFEAVHESLGRHVAIKVLPGRVLDNEQNIERFTREARAAAILHHNNIVSVFGVGHSDGHYYYVMEYVDGHGLDLIVRGMRTETTRTPAATVVGQTVMMDVALNDSATDDSATDDFAKDGSTTDDLPEDGSAKTILTTVDAQNDFQISSPVNRAERGRLSGLPQGTDRFRWAARIVSDVADALDYAHDQGILHRDIKPGNLLLDPSGRIWLTDFGLVKNIANHEMTMAGDIVGTPQYMAPESFDGKYDVPSEIYCLGATLYELVTLQPACEKGSTADIIRNITNSAPLAPRKIDSRVPQDLATIIEKSIARDSGDRYASAAGMRDDLRAFLEGRPISARAASIPKRMWLWSKRNPWQTVSAFLMTLVAAVATIGFVSRSNSLTELFRKNELLTTERDNTRKAKLLADRNAAKYREQYRRAESNVDLSLEMFDEMFKQLVLRGTGQQGGFSFDGFKELSGIETTVSEEDAEYLSKMLVFVKRFANQNSENTELMVEAARSFRRVANIYHLVGQPQEARSAYRRAIRLYESLSANAADSSATVDLARTSNELGALMLKNGEFRSALNIFTQTAGSLRTGPWKNVTAVRLELVRTLNLMGSSVPIDSTEELLRNRQSNSGEPARQRRKRRGIGGRFRTDQQLRQIASSHVEYVRQAIKLVDQLMDESDRSSEYLLERAKSFVRLAELQYSMRNMEASLESKQAALEDLSRLTKLAPDSAEYRAVLAQVYSMPIGQNDEDTLNQLTQALEISSELCQTWPRNMDYLQLDAEVHFQLGQLRDASGNPELAIKHLQTALNSLTEVVRQAPRNSQVRIRINLLTTEVADLLFHEKRFDEARDLLETGVQNLRDVIDESGRPLPAIRLILARHYTLLSRSYEKLGDTSAARRAIQLSREFRQRPPRADNK